MKRVTDEAGYREKETRQLRPGSYHVNASQLLPATRSLVPEDTRIRSQITGAIKSSLVPPVNEESDLRGLNRPTNRAPASFRRKNVSLGSHPGHFAPGNTPSYTSPTDVPHLRTLDSRLDLPAMALKGITPNRFHPNVFHNPSDFSFAPFDRLVSSRIVMKDQWRTPVSSLNRVNPPTIPPEHLITQKSAY